MELNSEIERIEKRDGSIVDFKPSRIENAIHRAFIARGESDGKISKKLTKKVVERLEKEYETPNVEDVQNKVVEVLKEEGYEEVGEDYQNYRKQKADIRELKKRLGHEPEIKMSINALSVLRRRYLLKDEGGKIIETPEDMFERVAQGIAEVDKKYNSNPKKSEKRFYKIMKNLEFLPNSPTLFNTNAPLGELSACYVLPVHDSLRSIFSSLKQMILIEQGGGGVGFNFSELRPKGDIVKSTKGVASGPVSFMRVFNSATDVVKAGGKRRGAMMGILDVNHPDILEFIEAKKKGKPLSNFNLSVAVTDDFMEKFEENNEIELINPRTGEVVDKMDSEKIWNKTVESAWKAGDPGLIFIDQINEENPTPDQPIKSTNPCVTGDTWVMTDGGANQIKDLIGEDLNIFLNGNSYKTEGFFKTGEKDVYKLITEEGFEIKATKDHMFLRADNITRYTIDKNWTELDRLEEGDEIILNNCRKVKPWDGKHSESEGYLIGLLVGDGTISEKRAILDCWVTDDGYEGIKKTVEKAIRKIPHRSNFHDWRLRKDEQKYRLRSTPLKKLAKEFKIGKDIKTVTSEVEKDSFEFYIGFLRGLFDADGSIQGNQEKGVSIRLSQSNLNTSKGVQRMLLRLGIFSKIYRFRRPASKKKFPDGKGGKKIYNTKPQHELIISNENIKRFHDVIGFSHTKKMNKLEKLLGQCKRELNRERFAATIKEIKSVGIKPVFDVNVNNIHSFDANGFIIHNCGEVPLLPQESCNLGSINLSKMVENGEVNWDKLKKITKDAVHFLDNVIDANKYPSTKIEEATKENRKIGLGVMGFADMLIKLKIPYDSQEALDLAEKIMEFIQENAREKSIELAKERGSFPNFENSIWNEKYDYMRNATVTSIAPTGTISIIGNCSSSIEPLFSVSFIRNVLEGSKLLEINPLFEKIAKERGFYSAELLDEISKEGSLQDIEEIPEDIKKIFKTSLDIDPEWHVKIQAAFQKYVDNSVSKTINLPKNAPEEEVSKAFKLAWELDCKGITVYRYGSKSDQVLQISEKKRSTAEPEFSGGCPSDICSL